MSTFQSFEHTDGLDTEFQHLIHKAKEALPRAYAPYSRFHVGAAVLLEDGSVITGTNQENAAYPACMCAERVALYAVASLHPEAIITKMAVVARKKSGKELIPVTPCGPCRQVMLEFETRQQQPIAVVMQHSEHQWVVAPSAESLLPYCFTKDNLPPGH